MWVYVRVHAYNYVQRQYCNIVTSYIYINFIACMQVFHHLRLTTPRPTALMPTPPW